MTHPLFDPAKITFVKADHTYYVEVDGKTRLLPSLSHVLKKSGMVPEYGAEIPPWILQKAANRGNDVHKATQNILTGLPWSVDKDYADDVKHAQELIRKHRIVPQFVEIPLFNPIFDYCCTPDLVGTVDGHPAIVDWKTTSKVHPEAGFQVAGQALCFRHPEEFDLYVGDLRNGVLHKFAAEKYLRVTRFGLQLYNDVQELREEWEA